MPEYIDKRIADGGEHPSRHRDAVHFKFRMHARDHDVELVEQLGLLIERTVVEDVALDAGQDPKRRELLVQLANHS